jgi:hypothetical protein
MEVAAVVNPRIQIGDIKPLAPVWPQRSIDKAKRKDNEPKQDDRQKNRQSRDEDNDRDGQSVDEYA